MANSDKSNIGRDLKFDTKAIHAGYPLDICKDRPVIPPIFNSSSYAYETVENPNTFYYSRCGNRSADILGKTMAALEGAEYGFCLGSGMSSIFAVTYLLNTGDHMVCSRVLYGGSLRLLKNYTTKKGIEVTFVEIEDLQSVEKAITDKTKVIYTESCSNPLLNIADIEGLSIIARKHKDVLLVVDNTFMTPYFQKPLQQGADVVLYSATKYLNGHGDAVMGILVTNHEDIYQSLKNMVKDLGLVPSPFDCFLVSRGLRTLSLRMKAHMKNAIAVAEFLQGHPSVVKVVYPGLPTHPQHSLAERQSSGFTGIVGFYISGGKLQVEKLFKALKIITNTGSLGQPNSLISYPLTVSHSDVTEEHRKLIGLTEDYIRLSVGLEDVSDIVEDLRLALDSLKE